MCDHHPKHTHTPFVIWEWHFLYPLSWSIERHRFVVLLNGSVKGSLLAFRPTLFLSATALTMRLYFRLSDDLLCVYLPTIAGRMINQNDYVRNATERVAYAVNWLWDWEQNKCFFLQFSKKCLTQSFSIENHEMKLCLCVFAFDSLNRCQSGNDLNHTRLQHLNCSNLSRPIKSEAVSTSGTT